MGTCAKYFFVITRIPNSGRSAVPIGPSYSTILVAHINAFFSINFNIKLLCDTGKAVEYFWIFLHFANITEDSRLLFYSIDLHVFREEYFSRGNTYKIARRSYCRQLYSILPTIFFHLFVCSKTSVVQCHTYEYAIFQCPARILFTTRVINTECNGQVTHRADRIDIVLSSQIR